MHIFISSFRVLFLLFFTLLCTSSLSAQEQHPHIQYSISDPTPTTGDQHFLVVLVDFSDQVGSFSQQVFVNQFFGTFATGSVADYFKEASYNNFRVTGDIVGASSGSIVKNQNTVAYLRLPNPKTFYADGNSGRNVGNFPRDLGGVFHHAMQALDDKGFDFSPYVNSATNYIENVIIVFAGRSSVESGNSNTLQPTGSTIDFQLSKGYGETSAGYRYANFTLCPESEASGQATIGVCVHEHGHGLGLPDLYDLAFKFSGAGNYTLMAYGTFGGNDGSSPAHPGPYEKIMMGWATPRLIGGTDQMVTLKPIESNADIIRLAANGTSKEYFLLENKQLTGFNKDLEGAGHCKGLYIWHIDENVIDQHLQNNFVNSDPSVGGPQHPGIIVVEADGGNALITPPVFGGDCSDVFTVGRTFNDSSTPNSKLWDGSASGIAVEVLSESAGELSLKITAPEPPASPSPSPSPSVGSNPNPSASPMASPDAGSYSLTAKARKRSIKGKATNAGTALVGNTVELYKVKKKSGAEKQVKTTTSKRKGNFKFKKTRRGTYRAKLLDTNGTQVAQSNLIKVKRK